MPCPRRPVEPGAADAAREVALQFNALALQLLTGLQVGAIYVLIALGLTLVFGTLGVVNFAHGALYLIGAYIAVVVAASVGHWLAFLCVPVVLFLVGLAMERGLIQFFYRRPVTDQILVTFGLALVVQEVARWIFGGTTIPYAPPPWAVIPVDIGIGYFPPWRLVIIGVTVAIVVALYLWLRYTRFGLVVRAGMRDPEMLRLLGINLTSRFTIVFGLGALLAGIAGAVGGPITSVHPEVGMELLVPSFLVVVIGGMGSVLGAVLAGFILGEAVSLSVLFLPQISQVIVYFVAAAVLLWRPRGLLGTKGLD